jgi:AcrR family transcriptional regulator
MQRPHDETSQALLAAAHRLLAADGAAALTVRRIAAEANMSTMNVYSRFGGKDGVIDELYAEGYRRLTAVLDDVPEADNPAEEIFQVALAYRAFARQHPAYYGIMFRLAVQEFDPSPESVEVALNGLSSFVRRVRRGQKVGQIADSEGCDAQEIAAWLWAMCHGIVSLELDSIAESYVSWPAIFENGLRTAVAGLHPSVAPIPHDR